MKFVRLRHVVLASMTLGGLLAACDRSKTSESTTPPESDPPATFDADAGPNTKIRRSAGGCLAGDGTCRQFVLEVPRSKFDQAMQALRSECAGTWVDACNIPFGGCAVGGSDRFEGRVESFDIPSGVQSEDAVRTVCAQGQQEYVGGI